MAENDTLEDLMGMEYGDEGDEGPMSEDAPPGEDIPVAPYDSLSVVHAVKACWEESDDAYKVREMYNRVNQDAAHCRQDLTNKVEGQSTEFLPKVAMALEQFKAFIKHGMVSLGNYFQVELVPDPAVVGSPLTTSGVANLIRHRLDSPEEIPPGATDFPTTLSDAVGIAALESLMILKVHGTYVPTRRLSVDLRPMQESFTDPMTGEVTERTRMQEELVMREGKVWRLLVELVRPDDYRPDPTGRGLYEIHRTYKDLYQVIEMAENGEYDPEAVAQLSASYTDGEVEAELERQTNQPITVRPDFRKEVELLEFWGTILDSDGNVAHRNVRCTVANQTYLIRRPEPNPYWHQESPFVVGSLLRVPFSVYHKALYDFAVRFNLAMNEVFNLIVDGALGAVWGTRQVHLDLVENADDFADGVPQGAVVFAKPEAPLGQPLMMQIPSGQVPPEAMQTFQLLGQEFDAATKLSPTSKGELPKKEVRATEVAAAEQSTGTFLESIVGDVERQVVRRVLRLAWLVMLQNCDDWNAEDVVGCIGPEAAMSLAQMSPAQRYVQYAQGARFKVSGLSSLMAGTRDFQKLMAMASAFSQSPILSQVFMQKCSPLKFMHAIFKAMNIDPEDLSITDEERAQLQQTMAELPFFQDMASGAQGNQQPQTDATQQPGSPVQQVQAAIARQQQVPQGL